MRECEEGIPAGREGWQDQLVMANDIWQLFALSQYPSNHSD